jgi:hypothetical protein
VNHRFLFLSFVLRSNEMQKGRAGRLYERASWKDEVADKFIQRAFSKDEVAAQRMALSGDANPFALVLPCQMSIFVAA